MNKLINIVVKVTDLCNFNCSYCFENENTRRKNNVFAKEKELLEFLKKFNIDDRLDFRFFGGEMFLYPKRIESIYKEIKKLERTKDVSIHFSFVTNASMPDSIIYLIKKDIFDLDMCKISWDGLCSHYTRGYKNSKNNIMFSINMINNIKKLSDYCKDKVLISMAVTKDNIKTLYNTYEFLNKIGYRKFEYYPIFNIDEINQYNTNQFISDFYNELTKIINIYNTCITKLHNYELYKGTYDYAYQCRTLGKQLHINTEGNIFACNLLDEMKYFNLNKEDIGNISNYNIDTIIKYLSYIEKDISFKSKEFCQDICDCQYKYFCNICPLEIILFKKKYKEWKDILKTNCPYTRIKETEMRVFSSIGEE